MSPFNPHEPPKPAEAAEATHSPSSAPPTGGGVRVIVHDRPARAPTWEEPEPRRRGLPDVIIVPEAQLTRDRDAFMASLDARWGEFIEAELARWKDVAKASRPDVHQAVLLIVSSQYVKERKAGRSGTLDNPEAYLRTVVDHTASNHARKKARRPRLDLGVELDDEPDAALDPEGQVGRAELREKLARYGDDLTPAEREVFEAREEDLLSFEMIATLLGRPLSTVHSQYARALKKLKGHALASERGTSLARGPTARKPGVDFQK